MEKLFGKIKRNANTVDLEEQATVIPGTINHIDADTEPFNGRSKSMIKAIFLDFYGTVVHEDDVAAEIAARRIAVSAGTETEAVRSRWTEIFRQMSATAHGENFETQRVLEMRSMAEAIRQFGAEEDAVRLCEEIFPLWTKPPIFPDAAPFFAGCPVPVYFVSNIDNADITACIAHHGLSPAGVFTSEDARSYKPRPELFRLALDNTGVSPCEVLHVGDSLINDVRGAGRLGITAIWLNREEKPVPDGVQAVRTLSELLCRNWI